MEKIEFEEGKIIEPAKVNEDNTITPAVWKGKTPLSPFVLNKLQDNIENDQVTQNKAIIKCLQEIETPTPVTGEKIDIKDSAEARITELSINGNSEQETREGKENICNIKSIFNGNGNAIKATYNTDRSMTFEKIADINAAHFGFILKDATTQNISLYMKYKIETSKESCTIGTRLDSGFFTDSTALDITGNISEITWTGKSAGKNISSLAFSSSGLNLGDKITVYSIYAVLGDTFEPIVPSLDYRSEVKCCGDNVNLLNYNNISQSAKDVGIKIDNDENIYDDTPTGDNRTWNYNKSNYFIALNKGTYTVTLYFSKQASEEGSILRIYSETSEIYFTSCANKDKVSAKFTLSEKTNIGIMFKIYDGICKIKLSEGTTTGEYSKYGQGCITEVICNNNLFDGTTSENNRRIATGTGGSYEVSNYSISDYIEIKSNTSYVVNTSYDSYYAYYDSNKKYLAGSVFKNNVKSYSNISNVKYIRFDFKTEDINNIQLEEKLATSYEEHKEQKYIIPTQAEMLEGDYFDFDNEKEVHTWKKMILDGTEDVDKITIDELNVFVFKTVEIDYKYINDNICNYKCNLFKAIKVNERYLDNTLYISGGKKINITSNNFTSVAELQSYLTEQYNTGTPVIIYYQLETPIRLAFTDEQKAVAKELKNAKTYNKITHIYSTDEISPNIEVTYKKNMEILFTNTLAESGV